MSGDLYPGEVFYSFVDAVAMVLDTLTARGLRFWQADSGLYWWSWDELHAVCGRSTLGQVLRDAVDARSGFVPPQESEAAV